MENKEKKSGRGGKRPGAGRPKGNSKLYSFRADQDLATYIDCQANKTDFIKECIRKQAAVQPLRQVGPFILPYFDVKVVAGFPIPLNHDELAQDIDVIQMLCPHPEASYIIRVQGCSMIEAGVNDGDLIIVDKSQRNPTEKQIAVCELNGEYTLKRVVHRNNRLWLVPANPAFPEIEIMEDDEFSVWGVVTYILHKPTF